MSVNISTLIPSLRLKIGDVNSTSYRYLDEWLLVALIAAVRGLARRWRSKYLIDDAGELTRNETYTDWEFDEDTYGTLQDKDEEIIVLKAALIILEGSLENSAWDVGSWRDAELSNSNIESGRLRDGTVKRFREELDSILRPPSKRSVGYTRISYPEG